MTTKRKSATRRTKRTLEAPPDSGTSFEDGLPYLKKTQREAGIDQEAAVFTSRDASSKAAIKSLQVTNIPTGFTKWQLPFAAYRPTNFYLTTGKPNAGVAEHAHEHGAGFRVVIQGSLAINGKQLRQGDWFYVPQGKAYSYKVGAEGVQLMSGYECCCQGWPCC